MISRSIEIASYEFPLVKDELSGKQVSFSFKSEPTLWISGIFIELWLFPTKHGISEEANEYVVAVWPENEVYVTFFSHIERHVNRPIGQCTLV